MSDSTHYRPLPQSTISPEGCYVQEAFNPPPISHDSPAILVMTDLARVPAATIQRDASLEEANQSMILRGVRLLLVVDEQHRIDGVVTSADILGEKPLLVAQKRNARRNEVRINDVMVSVDAMEALDIKDVRRASVGNIVATLKSAGRAHALVVGPSNDTRQALLGIFSASQIARQLGVQIHTYEMARTFAEIEALIAGV